MSQLLVSGKSLLRHLMAMFVSACFLAVVLLLFSVGYRWLEQLNHILARYIPGGVQ